MRDTFVKTLMDIAAKDKNVYLVTGDLGFGVLKPFWETYPMQFINAGISEQNMTSVAAGLSMEGKTVYTYSIGNFPTLRCLEQIRNDCAYHNANVKIVCVGGGFVYGSLGMSHHATEDLAILRALPDIKVMAPGDAAEAGKVTRAAYETQGTFYIRLGRGGEPRIHRDITDFSVGKALCVREGDAACIFSAGGVLGLAVSAADRLKEAGIPTACYSFPTVKPVDRDRICASLQKYKTILTVEEHNIVGGFGSAVAEVMADEGSGTKLIRIGLEDLYATAVGTQDYLREVYGITEDRIVQSIREAVGFREHVI